MTTAHVLELLFLGWLIGFALKYIFFGLYYWDSLLHPERLQADTTGPFKMFSKPFLGVFSA